MGLDMYLYAIRAGGPTLEEYHRAMDAAAWPEGEAGRFDLDAYKMAKQEAGVEVAYWRKANAIHAWFVDNFQDGVDKCQSSKPISKEAIAGLVAKCERILAGERGEELLPSRSGFFFGSTEYDEDYEYDLKETVAQLVPLLADATIDHFVYQSSW